MTRTRDTRSDGNVTALTAGLLRLFKILLYVAMAAAGAVMVAMAVAWSWFAGELTIKAGVDPQTVQFGLMGLLAGAIGAIYLMTRIVARLQAMVASVQDGDPFVRANARRLRQIGWLLIGIQLLGAALIPLAQWLNERVDEVGADASISISGLMGILLCFVLAQVFEEGALMRDELEGTV